jgi:hypothetical protein
VGSFNEKHEETELLMSKEKHKWKKKSDLERYVARNKKWRFLQTGQETRILNTPRRIAFSK